jgi:bifunctional UDP-N-acetylglucosamine pyrophosphorylase/glucosamine-1-phosphate N-acetyltransferase
MFDAVILAAGRGTRLRPLTDTMPKPLIPIAGRGSLLRLLDILPSSVDRILILVNHLAEQIRKAVGNEWGGREVCYVKQEPLDGTGGALRQARPYIRSERYLVCNGDDVYGAEDLRRLAEVERGLLVYPRPLSGTRDAWRVEDGRLRGLATPSAGIVVPNNVGVYLLGHEWFDTPPVLVPGKTDEWSLPHALPHVLDRYVYRAVPARSWVPCGTPEELRLAEVCLAETAVALHDSSRP